jgi:hypothetical protein
MYLLLALPHIWLAVLKHFHAKVHFIAVASDKVYQMLAHGRWVPPGTPASSTTKTGRHDIAEMLLKVALKHQKSNKSINRIKIY